MNTCFIVGHKGSARRFTRAKSELGTVVDTCDHSTWGSEAGELLPVQSQPGLHSKLQWNLRYRLISYTTTLVPPKKKTKGKKTRRQENRKREKERERRQAGRCMWLLRRDSNVIICGTDWFAVSPLDPEIKFRL